MFLDYHGRQYTVEGGVGGITCRGTPARVWIEAYNIDGHSTPTRSIRLDLHTVKEFRARLDLAIAEAEVAEVQWQEVMDKLPPAVD